MSYGVIYRHEFTDEYDRRKRADVLKKDYTGSITEKTGATHSPLHISIQSQGDDKYTTIKPTEIELKIFSDNFEFEAITEAEDKDYQIRVYEAPTEDGDLVLKHIGYVIPEIYSEPYVVEPYPASIRAASMGILNADKYVTDTYGEFYTGTATLMTVITRCLNKLGYEIDIWDSTNTYEDRITYQDGSPFKTIKVDQAAFVVEEKGREQALTCMEVLERVLEPFAVNFFMDYGRWVIIPIEHRATQRTVHIYDYQGTFVETGNYNPLAQTFNFLNQDQNLEFMPVIRDVESVFEHGLPNDAIVDPSFSKDFTIESVTDDTIQVPFEWDVNDLSDFTAFGFLMGCRLVAAPNDQSGPQAVCLDSDFIEDGAYIEFQGTKFIDFQEGDSFLFSLSYAGAAYERNSDDNDPNYIQPTKDNELTIDHKVQVKIGSYYLTADGEWTQTPTDIIITDLGDATSGASTLEDRDLGVASGFRLFEIPTEEVPEDGVAYARIYKPISENEGQFTGDSIAKVAYSLFSMTVYPEGEPPEEATTFFSERDVTSYAEEVSYDVHLGDGPTNLHESSFLINVGGNDLITSSWTRGSFSGGIEDVYINAIFLEYATKSNLIRGTQKVKGLFDRWFIDYSKGYTVLAGTYDERMCQFNGEMVEILNSEADVWGDPLGSPDNFSVEVATDPYTDFDDELFYIIDNQGADDRWVRKCTVNSVDGITVEASWQFPTTSQEPQIAFDEGMIAVLGNGNVLAYVMGSSSSQDVFMFLLDSDLTLINSVHLTSGAARKSVPRVFIDSDDSIYLPTGTTNTELFVRKYDSGLNFVYDTASFPELIFDFAGGNVTRDLLVIQGAGNGISSGAEDDIVYFFNKETGNLETTINRGYHTGVDRSRVLNFTDGRFVIIDEDDSNTINYYIYNKQGVQQSSGTISETIQLSRSLADTLEDDSVVLTEGDTFLRYNDSFVLQWDAGQINASYESRKLGFTTDPDKVLLYMRSSSNTGAIYEIDVNSETATLLDGFSTIQPLLSNGFGMKVENPWIKNVDTGTPTITNVVISADPSTGTVPFTSTITFGADNTGDADVTLLLTLDGVEVDSITIPAGGSNSTTHDEEFLNPGSFDVEFAGSSITITANGDTVSGGSEGYIDIESSATDDTEEVQPDATIDVIQVPSQQSDTCGTGGTEFNVEWKLTDYCSILPDGPDKVTVAQAVSGNISSGVTGLGSTYSGLSPSGYPRIRVYSETAGTADNGESVTFGVPSVLEQNGGVFNRYEIFLTGGVDEYIVNEQIDILIGGSVFATTSAIDNLETADSIAQKIYDACVAVGSGVYSFAKNGTRVLVGSTGGAESLDLDIKNAGFSYSTQDLEAV